ncbi:hypothetical protein ACHAPU_002822 [Fusarium lateritium]
MTQSTEPSYLLADFPPTDDHLDARGNKNPDTTESSLKDADAPAPAPGKHEEGGFRRKFMPGRLLADCTAALLPIALVAFAIAVMRLDKRETEKAELRKWENAITIIASIFPILFASVVGRMVFEAARWKLEKGATLGLLEQLIGSRTVGSTLTTQINLGKFNILGLVLLVLWAFSPLGSQSVLRMLGTELDSVNGVSQAFYFSTDAQSQVAGDLPSTPQNSELIARTQNYVSTMYRALFLTSKASKIDPMDLWGNLKIPNMDIDDDGWHTVSSDPGPDSYSALIGIPITNVTKGNMTFSLESSYLRLECYNLTRTNRSDEIESSFNWTDPSPLGYQPMLNGTWHGRNKSELQSPWSMAVDRFVGPYWADTGNLSDRYNWTVASRMYGCPVLFENETNLDIQPSKLLFEAVASNFGSAQTVEMGLKAECHVLQRYVES